MSSSLYKRIGRAIAYNQFAGANAAQTAKSAGTDLLGMVSQLSPSAKLGLLGMLAGGGAGAVSGAVFGDERDSVAERIVIPGIRGASAGGLGGYLLGRIAQLESLAQTVQPAQPTNSDTPTVPYRLFPRNDVPLPQPVPPLQPYVPFFGPDGGAVYLTSNP